MIINKSFKVNYNCVICGKEMNSKNSKISHIKCWTSENLNKLLDNIFEEHIKNEPSRNK